MDKVDVRFPQPAKAPPRDLPMNAMERAAALGDLMERLAATLDRETAALAAHRPLHELAAIAKDKPSMAMVLEEVGRLLRVDREGMANLSPELVGRLRAATHTLRQATDDNIEALRRTGNGQRILVDTVVSAINLARRVDQPTYGPAAAGFYSNSPRRLGAQVHGPATSATLNTQL